MRIGFLSFRIAGNDGVSLEARRWKTVLERLGHRVVFVAGELDVRGILIPELHFTNPQIYAIQEAVIKNHKSYTAVEKDIFSLAGKIEGELRDVFQRYTFDHLIVANVFSLPLHFPLAIALERVITELKLPTVARHHDFWWERQSYLKSSCFTFFQRYFPPKQPLLTHVTISSLANSQLIKRFGITSHVIPDSFDFKSKLASIDEFSANWRSDFDIKPTDIVFLQPTRIVPRKNIELSIELLKKLNDPRAVLVLVGDPSDEGLEYAWKLYDLTKKKNIRAKFIGHRVGSSRAIKKHQRIYTLWDCFANCDFVTYPSSVEGFGNQFIEAVYFQKPILVNRYHVYKTDIKPLGFAAIEINGKITNQTINKVKHLLNDLQARKRMTDNNFKLGNLHFSFEALQQKLKKLGF